MRNEIKEMKKTNMKGKEMKIGVEGDVDIYLRTYLPTHLSQWVGCDKRSV